MATHLPNAGMVMSDSTGNGKTDFDLVLETRRDLDRDIKSLDRRLGLVEATLSTRVDMLVVKIETVLDGQGQIFSELRTLADYIVRVLDRTMDVEKRIGALEDVATPIVSAPKRRVAARKK